MDLLLWLLIGILGGNAVPHLVKGITKEQYPCVLGNGPVPNFIGGWLCIVLTSVLVRLALNSRITDLDLTAGLIGLLLIGLFHSAVGAFGRK
jgi:CDP-diglyceride synthetase